MAIKINGTVVIDDSRNIQNVGNVDGRDVSVDGAKLDGIEANADVTDGANVGAALTGYTTESTIASDDILPVYDTSAGAWRKATVTNTALVGPKGQKGTTGDTGAKGQKAMVVQRVAMVPRAKRVKLAILAQQVQLVLQVTLAALVQKVKKVKSGQMVQMELKAKKDKLA